MKKCFLVCIMSFVFVLKANAQTEYGVKGGINFSNNVVFKNSDFTDTDGSKAGFHLGVFIKEEIKAKWNLKLEMLFSRKGKRYDSDFQLNLDYLNVPIIFEYNVFDKLYIETGAEMGYLLSAQGKYDNEFVDASDLWDNLFDLGLSVGLNYYINKKIFLNARYTHGLLSVNSNNKFIEVNNDFRDIVTTVYYLNRNFQLSLNYIFK